MANEVVQYYRVSLTDEIEVDVTHLDVSLVDKSLEKSPISSKKKQMLHDLFLAAVRKGRFRLLEGDINEMGHRS